MDRADFSPHRGVFWRRERQSWRIKLKQRARPKDHQFYLEHKGDSHVAALIYDAVARMVYGRDAAVVNFPGEKLPTSVLASDLFGRLVKAGWLVDSLHPLETPPRTAVTR